MVDIQKRTLWTWIIKGERYQFKLNWPLFVIVMLTFMGLVSLGNWQRRRAHEKQRIQANYQAHRHKKPLYWPAIKDKTRIPPYYPVTLPGHYDDKHNLLLDNQFNNHQVGYHVITPWIVPGTNRAVMVDRGWARALDMGSKPLLSAIKPVKYIHGLVKPLKADNITLGPMYNPNDDFPVRIQTLKRDLIEKLIKRPVSPMMVLLSPNDPNGYVRDWQPHFLPPSRHYSYSWQWYIFALILAAGYTFTNLRRLRR